MPDVTDDTLADVAELLEQAGRLMGRIADAALGLTPAPTADDMRPLRELADQCARQADNLADLLHDTALAGDVVTWRDGQSNLLAGRLPAGARYAMARVGDGELTAGALPQPNGTWRLMLGHSRSALVVPGTGRPAGRVPTLGEAAQAVRHLFPTLPRPAFAAVVTGEDPTNLLQLWPAGLTVERAPAAGGPA